MKRLALVFIFIILLLVLSTASCKEAKVSPASSEFETSYAFDIPSGIEVAYVTTDCLLLDDLHKIEDYSTIIVEAVANKNIGQKVDTSYDYELKKDLPGAGFTKWEIEVTKVYKGDVKAGDKLILLMQYYLWTNPDGKEQLVTGTSLKPAVRNQKYIMFLIYDKNNKGYCPVCDYEGMFSIPTKDIKTKANIGALAQADDPDVYNNETLEYLVPIYNEVVQKYFN